MFYLIHLFVLVVSTAIYAAVYSAVLILLIYVLAKITRWRPLVKRLRFRLILWPPAFLLCFFGLFFYAFSDTQDMGRGDYSRIPIGNGYEVSCIDGVWAYFEDEKKPFSRQAGLKTFAVEKGYLCASYEGFNRSDCKDCFLVFDIEKEKMHLFSSTEDYHNFAGKHKLPMASALTSFDENYATYWRDKNRWYLPW